MSSLEQSVDYLDSMFDEALSGSSLRETSVETSSNTPYTIASESNLEPFLCVPRILSLVLSSLEENWDFDASKDLKYDLNQVLPVIEFYRQKNHIPANVPTAMGLSILRYVLENMRESFLPVDHYSAWLHVALLFDISLQTRLLQSLLRDLPLLAKIILDRIVTVLSQLLLACGAPHFRVTRRPRGPSCPHPPRHRAVSDSRAAEAGPPAHGGRKEGV